MTRSNTLTYFLVGLVVVAVVVTSASAIYYVWSVRKLHTLQLQTAMINRNRTLASSLVNEAVEYSRRNPAIDPILQAAGIKPSPAPKP